ncbi:hypothetical protein CK203_117710 [Vitis vinifera]|uniref:Uncharacterized protein n=1 Tax=Vitis vinifera TaxID=29760 RepID=A0A438BN70_VITVI|nr:hypothetical protein CK203_117710 [Vitis vinifera]
MKQKQKETILVVLAGNHFLKIWTTYNIFLTHISLQDWIRQHQLVIGHRLNQELNFDSTLIFPIGDMFEAIQYLVSSKKLEDGFGMDNVAVVNGRGKLQDYVMTIWD